MTDAEPAEAEPEELRVTTLEAFFDLVFVSAVTQLTSVLVHQPTPTGLARTVLLLAVVWWMYGGYAWLTNAVPAVRPVPKALLVLAMAGFLVIALAVPTAFGSGALAFAIGYLLVVAVHAGLFLTVVESRRAMARVSVWNLGAAVLLLVAVFVPGPVRWGLWVVAAAGPWLVRLRGPGGSFRLRPGHFVERHGLVLLVAFGESIAAIGVGVAEGPLRAGVVLAAVLTLVVLAGLWWSYFGGEDAAAERSLSAVEPAERARMSLNAYGHAFLLLLGGVIVLAAGVRTAMVDPWRSGQVLPAVAIGGGIAVYLAGDLLLRVALGLRPLRHRIVAALLALASTAVGIGSIVGQLAAVAAVLFGTVAVERGALRRETRRRHTEPSDTG